MANSAWKTCASHPQGLVGNSNVCCGRWGLGLLIASFLPKEYTSQTLVLVAKPTVPSEYVKPVVTEDLNRRLASMQEQILSRTRLEPVIEQFGLYHDDRNKVHVEELIDRLRKAIEISPLAPMAGTEDRSMPGFSVKVTFNNPQSAQQICNQHHLDVYGTKRKCSGTAKPFAQRRF